MREGFRLNAGISGILSRLDAPMRCSHLFSCSAGASLVISCQSHSRRARSSRARAYWPRNSIWPFYSVRKFRVAGQ